eukprot:m.189542 g.189542  ORF g.189542 m.189542 type:complete len:105 (-) comp32377_c0_seq2:371-685(-)
MAAVASVKLQLSRQDILADLEIADAHDVAFVIDPITFERRVQDQQVSMSDETTETDLTPLRAAQLGKDLVRAREAVASVLDTYGLDQALEQQRNNIQGVANSSN